MSCEHKYYVPKKPLFSSLAYRMYCRYCLYTHFINVPKHIPDGQRRLYINEYVVKANTKKDFVI